MKPLLIPLPKELPGSLLTGLIKVFESHKYSVTLEMRPRGRGNGISLVCVPKESNRVKAALRSTDNGSRPAAPATSYEYVYEGSYGDEP